MIEDSGERQEFDTGSKRDTDDGKGWPHAIPTTAIRRLAVHFQDGAKKYAKDNWKKGQPLTRYYDSAMRHLMSWSEGEKNEDHLAAAMWNVVAAMWTEEAIEDGSLPLALDDFIITHRGRVLKRAVSVLAEAERDTTWDYEGGGAGFTPASKESMEEIGFVDVSPCEAEPFSPESGR